MLRSIQRCSAGLMVTLVWSSMLLTIWELEEFPLQHLCPSWLIVTRTRKRRPTPEHRHFGALAFCSQGPDWGFYRLGLYFRIPAFPLPFYCTLTAQSLLQPQGLNAQRRSDVCVLVKKQTTAKESFRSFDTCKWGSMLCSGSAPSRP